jgi:hypothetical protein
MAGEPVMAQRLNDVARSGCTAFTDNLASVVNGDTCKHCYAGLTAEVGTVWLVQLGYHAPYVRLHLLQMR